MLRPLAGMAAFVVALFILGAVYGSVGEQVNRGVPEVSEQDVRGLSELLSRLDEDDAQRLAELLDDLDPEQQQELVDALRRMDPAQLSQMIQTLEDMDPGSLQAMTDAMSRMSRNDLDDLLDVAEGMDPDQLAELADLLSQIDGPLSSSEQRRLEDLAAGLSRNEALALAALAAAMGADAGSIDDAIGTAPRPMTSDAGGLTGSTDSDPVPGPTNGAKASPDRRGESDVTCYAVFDPYLGCAKRWQVMDRIDAGYALSQSPSSWQEVSNANDRGTVYRGEFTVSLVAGQTTPIFSVAPGQQVMGWSLADGTGATLVRDQHDVYALQASATTTTELFIAVRDDTGYRSGIPDFPRGAVPGSQVPAELVAQVQPWLDANGYWGRDDLGAALRDLQQHILGFEGGAPLSEAQQPDFFLAVMDGERGCCRHFATVFVAAAQAMGAEARFVYNEGHAFAEVRTPAGWREVQLGGCDGYEVEDTAGRRADPDAAATNEDLEGRAPSGTASTRTTTTIDPPPAIRKGEPFTITGRVQASGGGPADAPVRLYVNETKQAPGTYLGKGVTRPGGAWSITTTFPNDLPPGDYQLVAHHRGIVRNDVVFMPSWSDPPIVVGGATSLRLDAPEVIGPRSKVPVTAHLVDDDGNGIRGQPVRLQASTGLDEVLETDRSGRISATLPAAPAGTTVTITATFDGDQALDASSAEASYDVVSLRFEAGSDGVLKVPAGDWTLRGLIVSEGGPLPSQVDVVAPWVQRSAAVGQDGSVTLALAPPPGESMVRVVAETGLLGTVSIWAQEATALELVSDQSVQGSPVVLRVTGLSAVAGVPVNTPLGQVWSDEQGFAQVRGEGSLQVSIDEAPSRQAAQILVLPAPIALEPLTGTHRGGFTTIPFQATPDVPLQAPFAPIASVDGINVTGTWDGNTAVFQGLPATSSLVIETGFPGHVVVASAAVALVPEPADGVPWIVGVVILVLLVVGVLVWLWPRIVAAWPRLDIEVHVDGRPGLPIVAVPDVPLRLRCVVTHDGEAVSARPHLGINGQRLSGEAVELVLPAGQHRLKVRARQGLRLGRLQVTVHVADWEEHISRSYDTVRAQAEAASGDTGLSPRMVADHLGGDALEAIRLFERAAFGNAPVDENDWVTFATLTRSPA